MDHNPVFGGLEECSSEIKSINDHKQTNNEQNNETRFHRVDIVTLQIHLKSRIMM